MSTIRVWVRVDRPRKNPVRVEVTEGSEIYDVIEAAISEEKLDISPADVTVKFNGEAVDGDAVVSEFSTSCKNPLLLELAEQEGPQPKRRKVTYEPPSLGNTTPSTFPNLSSAERNKIRQFVSPYRHWLALEIYECFQTLKLDTTTISISVNHSSFEVSLSSLDKFVSGITTIVTLEESCAVNGYRKQANLLGKEIVKTAQLAREMDRFLFPDGIEGGACYHQLPSRSKSGTRERPGFYVLGKTDGLLLMPVLVSDFKNMDLDIAREETIAYAVSCLEGCTDKCAVILGLAMTCKDIELFVCVGHSKKMMAMKVCTVNIASHDDLRKFLCVLYGCVHSLLKNPIETDTSSAITSQCSGDHTLLSSRVIKCSNGIVHKYYDAEEFDQCLPNIDFIASLGEYALPGVQCRKLSPDGRFQVLEYDYLDGSHVPNSIDQVATIIRILSKIHD